MVPIVSIVGKSNSGKTTLIEKLLEELIRRNYKVATIKHDAHDFEVDIPGKDTWRHARAGSSTTVISSPHKVAFIKKVGHEWSLDEIIRNIDDVDLIVTEGYKRENKPKIEVLRAERSRELISSREELIAVAADFIIAIPEIPVLHLNDTSAIADIIEDKILGNEIYKLKGENIG